jgi:hypothetical protein
MATTWPATQLAPAPRDSGRIHGNLYRPRRYNRALNRVFYICALASIHFNTPTPPETGFSTTLL